jgi:serine/threonine protein kinase
MALIVADRFHVKRKLTSGSFGEIYIATDGDDEVALKLEPIRTRTPQLLSEASLLHILEGGVGIPTVFWVGREVQFQIMAMERLGESLESLKRRVGHSLGLKTVLMIVDQTLARIEFVHRRNIIHSDVKPENFLIGVGQRQNLVYLIDFGLSRQFRDLVTGAHIVERENAALTGTARYASVNAMKGHEQSRRDDLESLGYMWLYLLKGALPWQALKAARGDVKETILQKKMEMTIEEVCEGVPNEFAEFFRVVKGLAFEEDPPYAEFRAMFRELFVREGFVYDYQYDWTGMVATNPAPQAFVRVRPRPGSTPKTMWPGPVGSPWAAPSAGPTRIPRTLRR